MINEQYAAVLSDGRCTLHLIDITSAEESSREKYNFNWNLIQRVFPQGENEK